MKNKVTEGPSPSDQTKREAIRQYEHDFFYIKTLGYGGANE